MLDSEQSFARLGRRQHARHACESRRGEIVHAGNDRSLSQPVLQANSRPQARCLIMHPPTYAHSASRCRVGDGRQFKAPRPGIAALRSRPIALVTHPSSKLKGIARRQGRIVESGGREVTLAPNRRCSFNQCSGCPITGATYELQSDDRAEFEGDSRGAWQADVAVFRSTLTETAQRGEFDAEPATLASGTLCQAVPRCGRRGARTRGDSTDPYVARHRDLQGLRFSTGSGAVLPARI
jgi:hypothetical protein